MPQYSVLLQLKCFCIYNLCIVVSIIILLYYKYNSEASPSFLSVYLNMWRFMSWCIHGFIFFFALIRCLSVLYELLQ